MINPKDYFLHLHDIVDVYLDSNTCLRSVKLLSYKTGANSLYIVYSKASKSYYYFQNYLYIEKIVDEILEEDGK